MKFLYVYYDRVAGVYGNLVVEDSEALAIRRFNYIVGNSPMVMNDMQLFKVGEFDFETGVITAFDKPDFVCNYEKEVN